ncbi:MAG: hypothetical protein IIV16_02580 [Alistipes sp.]|nr:hypothetical protein [Alistipes sp.]
MVKFLRNIAVVVVAVFTLTGCFKKVTTDTTLRIKVLSEEASGGSTVEAEGCYAYVYYTEKEDWTIASYDDAAAKTITHSETGEKLTEPDGEAVIWTKDGTSSPQYLELFQDKAPALVVVVYPAAQMYAYTYRKAEAENLTYTYLTLIFHRWKTGEYYEGSREGYRWTVVAPDTPITPPTDDTVDDSTDNPTDDSTDNTNND